MNQGEERFEVTIHIDGNGEIYELAVTHVEETGSAEEINYFRGDQMTTEQHVTLAEKMAAWWTQRANELRSKLRE